MPYNYGSLENPPYYLTAYGIAVKHGYQGTEEEWIHEIQESAHDSSIAAAASAESALQSKGTAEAFGAGTRGGEPLDEDDPAYHNNAQYYADHAEAYGAGTRGGEPVEEDDPAYHNNAQYFAGQAQATADGLDARLDAQDTAIATIRSQVASPYVIAATGAAMTDQTKAYVYVGDGTGDDAGLVNGAWYYYDADAEEWTQGGTATDPTLSVAGAAADAKACGDLKSALVITGENEAVTITSTWEIGVIYPTTGTDGTNNARIRCKPIYVPTGKITLTVDSGYQFYLYVYPNGVFDSTKNSGWKTGTFSVDIPYGYIRVCVANTSGTEANVSYADHLNVQYKSNVALLADKTMSYFNNAPQPTFGVADMPENSYIYILASRFADCPAGMDQTHNIYIAKSNMGATGYNSLVRVYDTTDFVWYTAFYSNNLLQGVWEKEVTRDEIVRYFNTAPYTTFSVADMPANSYAYTISSKFNGSPVAIGTNYIYVCRVNMGATGYNSLVRVYDVAESIWYTAVYTNNAIVGEWSKDTGIEVTNNYDFRTTENNYNVTAMPRITADTNNYLAPSGDTTDRTTDIAALLSTGVCHLGPGDYYITGIDMPLNAELVGSGWKTRLIVADSVTSGYGVKLSTNSIVRDLRICRASDAILPDTIGNVHGILYAGTRTPSDNTPSVPLHATISNVFVHGFVGGGITCYGTGLGYDASINADNICIYNCFAGINVSYYSEFHRFTNCNVWRCVYGSIVNGGNNVFANCGFNGNKINMLFDNEYGQSPNNTHGSVVGCTIHHSNYNDNDGQNIVIKGAKNGEVFTGCQISHGSIDLDEVSGVVFSGCNMLSYTPLNITDSLAVMFNGCVFRADANSTVYHSGNTGLKFANCMKFDGADYNPAN